MSLRAQGRGLASIGRWGMLSLVVLSLALAGCSKKKSTKSTQNPSQVGLDPTAQIPPNQTGVQRYCTTKLNISSNANTAAARLADFFQTPVSNLEGDVTICFRVNGYGTFLTNAAVRVEYEDHYGVSGLEFNQSSNVFYAEVKQSGGTTSFEVIFMDGVGFLQVKGSGSNSANVTLRYHNFPTLEEYLEQQLADIQNKCKNGTMTVAQCLGYNFPPTFWWNNGTYVSPQQQQLNLARSILNDSSKSKTLGTAVMYLTDVIFK